MYPVISLGGIAIPTYWVAISAGFMAAGWFVVARLQRAGLGHDRALVMVAAGMLSGAVGARGFHLLLEWLLPLVTDGRASMGPGLTVTGCLLSVPVMAGLGRRYGLSAGVTLDACMPPVALGQAFGRLGCAAAGCCAGRPTEGWLAILAPGRGGEWLPRYPAQLVASAADLAIFVGLLLVERRWARRPFPGVLAGLFVILASVKRLAIEEIREEAVVTAGLTWAQLVAVAVLALTGAAMAVAWRTREPSTSR